MCDCMTRVNGNLKAHNTKLSVAFYLSPDLGAMGVMPMIQSEKITTSARGKPMTVIPTFCPFCGVKYPRADDQTAPPEADHG